MNDLIEDEIKKDYILYSITLFLSIFVYIILAFLIDHFYNPNLKLILENSKEILIPSLISALSPEPKEKFLAITLVLIFPILVFSFSFYTNKFLYKINSSFSLIHKQYLVISWITLILFSVLLFLLFGVEVIYHPTRSMVYYFFGEVRDDCLKIVYFFIVLSLFMHVKKFVF